MLTPRLKTISDKVKSKTIADIGTDHAYIPIELARSGKIDKAIACDINKGPLEIAKANIKKYGLEDKIELRLGGGLTPIHKNETDCIIIAGMGGQLIWEIIHKDIDTAKQAKELILQPMNAQAELRKNLIKHGFEIVEEDLVAEGFKVYNIFVAREGHSQPCTDFEYHIPKALHSHKLFNKFLAKKHREFSKILKGLKKASKPDESAIAHYAELLGRLEAVMKQ
ncbi:MAG: class I SAM-dependent methyltransferase [Clostridia bacterium]|nr:class I SAM-dependent methyltransferase [Clostridia bacterium]